MRPLRQAALRHLAALALGRTGQVDAARMQLSDIPAHFVEELLEELDRGGWRPADRLRLCALLASDPRPRVRRRVAESLGGTGFSLASTQRLIEALVSDRCNSVRAAAADTLATLLREADELDQADLAWSWATSARRPLRLAIARALSMPFALPAADLVIELLASDRSPEVCAAAARAAEVRFDESPDVLGAVLEGLVAHPSRAVRRAARRAARARLWGAAPPVTPARAGRPFLSLELSRSLPLSPVAS